MFNQLNDHSSAQRDKAGSSSQIAFSDHRAKPARHSADAGYRTISPIDSETSVSCFRQEALLFRTIA